MLLNDDQLQRDLFEVLGRMASSQADHDISPGTVTANLPRILGNYDLPQFLYKPDKKLQDRLKDFENWLEGAVTHEKPGELLEEIALLAFKNLKGWDSIKSFQSYTAQHDLVISGSNSSNWWLLIAYLHLPVNGRSVVVECKNTDNGITDEVFTRLCSLLHTKFGETCHLGVFLSRSGATGFPESDRANRSLRQRKLSDARASQVLFHAKTKKFVIVLDLPDIMLLGEEGALPRILEAKVRDLEDAAGLPLNFEDNWVEVDLPAHLQRWMNN